MGKNTAKKGHGHSKSKERNERARLRKERNRNSYYSDADDREFGAQVGMMSKHLNRSYRSCAARYRQP